MSCTAPPPDYYLHPGEFFFGRAPATIGTLLGSCVAITMWHPRWRTGGMCHYLLPRSGTGPAGRRAGDSLDGRYADEAMALFMKEIEGIGSSPGEYEVKIAGGGDQFEVPPGPGRLDVGAWNATAGLELLRDHGFRVAGTHLGGRGSRYVILDLESGRVSMRHNAPVLSKVAS